MAVTRRRFVTRNIIESRLAMDTIDIAVVMQKQFPRIYRSLLPYEIWPKALYQAFPRVLAEIEEVWGQPEGYARLNELLLSDRPGRAGFQTAVLDELIILKNVFEVNFDRLASNPHDPFSKQRAQELAELVKKLAVEARRRKEIAIHQEEMAAEAIVDPLNELNDDETHTFAKLEQQLADLALGRRQDGKSHRKLGEILRDARHLALNALDRALAYQASAPTHHLIGELLVSDGAVSLLNVIRACCIQRGIPVVDASRMEVSTEALRLVPLRIARIKGGMPIAVHDRRLVVAVPNPFDHELQEYFSFVSGCRVVLVFANPERIMAAHANYDESLTVSKSKGQGVAVEDSGSAAASLMKTAESPSLSDDLDEGDGIEVASDLFADVDENDETVIGLVNKVVNDAIRLGASDIHFEAFPRSKNAQIRFRRDGVMERHSEYPVAYHPAVVSRIG